MLTISKEKAEEIRILGEEHSIIKNVSNIVLKCMEDGDLSGTQLQSLMHTLNDRIIAFDLQLKTFVDWVDFEEK